MSEFTPLREAVDTLAGRRPSPDFGELERRATRRGRRRVALAAAGTAAVIAGSVLAVTHVDNDRRTAPIGPPKPTLKPANIIAHGHLYAFAEHKSGAVLTIWTDCQNDLDADCGHAWRLGTGARPLATGILTQGEPHAYSEVHAGEDGFVLSGFSPFDGDRVLRVGLDGTSTSSECLDTKPPVESGRLVWDGSAHDTAGVFCPTMFGGGDLKEDIEARPLAGPGAFTSDGRLWALVANDQYGPPRTLTIGMFDGSRWHYRDIAQDEASESHVAAAGSNVVVLSRTGISVTTDDGAFWHQVTAPPMLKWDLPYPNAASMAFAGSHTLYIADSHGGLWRSTDLATFHLVKAPGGVHELTSAGDGVLALEGDTNDLVRITADGRVKRLTVR